MSKKRGVLISTMDHTKTVNKSKSSHTHPLPNQLNHHPLLDHHNNPGTKSGAIDRFTQQQLAESNLLSEQPEKMVNQAYYTYQDPDSMPHYDSNRLEDNEEYVIESMQKRKEYLEHMRREEERRALLEKNKQNALKNSMKKNKGASPNKPKSASVNGLKRVANVKGEMAAKGNKKTDKEDDQTKKIKKAANLNIPKPRPLVFSVNMFAKGSQSPRHNEIDDQSIQRLSDRINYGVKTSRIPRQQASHQESSIGQSLNCKKLPFRFQGIL